MQLEPRWLTADQQRIWRAYPQRRRPDQSNAWTPSCVLSVSTSANTRSSFTCRSLPDSLAADVRPRRTRPPVPLTAHPHRRPDGAEGPGRAHRLPVRSPGSHRSTDRPRVPAARRALRPTMCVGAACAVQGRRLTSTLGRARRRFRRATRAAPPSMDARRPRDRLSRAGRRRVHRTARCAGRRRLPPGQQCPHSCALQQRRLALPRPAGGGGTAILGRRTDRARGRRPRRRASADHSWRRDLDRGKRGGLRARTGLLPTRPDRARSTRPGAAAIVEPGVIPARLTAAAAGHGLRFGPDPSTANRCTIGGMIGNNACGPRALGYGRTADNVLGLDVITGYRRAAQSGRARPARRRLPHLEGTGGAGAGATWASSAPSSAASPARCRATVWSTCCPSTASTWPASSSVARAPSRSSPAPRSGWSPTCRVPPSSSSDTPTWRPLQTPRPPSCPCARPRWKVSTGESSMSSSIGWAPPPCLSFPRGTAGCSSS